MSRLSLGLFGSLRVSLDGQAVNGFASGKVRALLAYLVVEAARPQPREFLASLLWPDQPDRAGRHSLSQALSNLRQVIADAAAAPPFLLINRDTIQWNNASDYVLDINTFAQHLKTVDKHPHPRLETCATCQEQLQKAVTLYQGEFLSGLPLDYSTTLEEWATLKRSHLERQMLQALQQLAHIHEARGEYAQARQVARQQIGLDPLHEPAYQQVMRTYVWDGRRAAALRQYHELTQLLETELGVTPSLETTRLYEAIKERTLTPPTPIQPVVPRPIPSAEGPSGETRPAFVARQRELDWLKQLTEMAVAGRGRIVFIVGETGSGKTALLHELAWQAQKSQPALLAAIGNSNAHTGLGDPYLPFREILGQLIGDNTAQTGQSHLSHWQTWRVAAALPVIGEAFVNVAPDLLDTFVPGQSLSERVMNQARVTAESWAAGQGSWLARLEELLAQKREANSHPGPEQSRLFEQVVELFKTVAATYPLLLLLDDLQWADAGSINLLFHLGRNLKNSHILIVGAFRGEDVALGRNGERHPLESVVNEFKRAYGNVTIDLDAAAESESRYFVDAFLDSQPNLLGESFRAALHRQTDGHPLFTVELLRDLIARGDISKDERGRWVERAGVNWETLPARVEGAIAERIGRLDPALQEALTIASVEGETFTAEVIAQVQAGDKREIVRRLSHELAQHHHLVTPLGVRQVGEQRLSLYRFRHNLFQKYLYHRMDAAERAYLHEDVGQVLETLWNEQAGEIAVQLARHFQAAGQTAKTVTYLRRAADRAMRLSAYQEAIALYSHSLQQLKSLPNTPERVQEELSLQIALGISYSVTKGFASPRVEQAFARARALCQQIGNTPDLFPTLWGLFYYYLVRAEDRAMQGLAEQLRQMATNVTDPVLRPIGHWAKGVTLLYAGQLEPAAAHLEEMVAYYDPQQHRSPLFRYVTDPSVACRFWSAWALWLLGYPDQSLQRNYEALALAQQLNHPFSLAFALFTSTALYQFRNEPREALRRAEATLNLADELGFAFFQGLGLFFKGWALTELGDLNAGLAQMRQGMAASQATGARIGLPHMLGLLAQACGRSGETTEGLTLLAEALVAAHDSGERHYEAELYRLKGELLCRTGDVVQAEACFSKAIEIARWQRAKSWELRATLSLCELWEGKGNAAAFQEHLPPVYTWFREGFNTPDLQAAKERLTAA